MTFTRLFFVCTWLFLISCNSNKKEVAISNSPQETLFSLLSPDSTGIHFFNKIVNQKNFNIFKYRNFYNGGGVAIGDINNDGLPDIFFTSNQGANKLYLNKGNLIFEDISKSANIEGTKPWSTGVTMVDINQDGLLDIYVSNAGNMEGNNHDNDLYINNGNLTFTEQAAQYNLAKTGFTTHATFFDYDKDGDLDAYILNNSNIPVSSLGYAHQRDKRAQDWENVPEIFRGVGDMLLRNDNGKFVDVSEEAKIYGSLIGFGLGVVITDINDDLYPDIYVSNDFYERDYLYINNQDGTFTEDIKNWVSHLSLSAMGVDIADINNDGFSDIFITDMLPESAQRTKSVMTFEGYNVFKLKQSKDFYQQYIQNTLQLNNGNGSFSEIANFSGISATDWSWAGLLFDMDNDGFKDIYVTNGVNHDMTDLDFVDFFANDIIQNMALTGKKQAIDSIINKMPQRPQSNYAYKNNHDLTFSNETENWGFSIPSFSNGAAYADLDNDGDLDLVVNNVNMNSFVFRNNSEKLTKNNYLKVKLSGSESNKFAIGATLKVYANQSLITQEQIPSRGFQSSMDYTLNVGLGKAEIIDSLQIIWPNGKTQKLFDIQPNQTLQLDIKNALNPYKKIKKTTQKTFLTELPNTFETHQENTYSDFDHEGLIYKMLSQEGPTVAVADVNNDGNEDVFIGGGFNQSGNLYLNLGNNKWKSVSKKSFQMDAQLEDTAVAFFDADGDGDLDLMVGNSGNEISQSNNYGVRLYLNDGKGNFVKSSQKIPSSNTNISKILPYDFDADGDEDVLVTSRSIVGTYGVNPAHLFLENTGNGIFLDATDRYAYELRDAGMITDALWKDMDGDTKKDLVTVSDWGSPNIYKNTGKRLSKLATNLDNFHGWWRTVKVSDIDNDGDFDLILGNQGKNTLYKASESNPMKMWINDYDNNGTLEQIFTTQTEGADYPIHMKKELTEQIVSLNKENLKSSEYANKTINQLFSKEIIENAIQKKVTVSASVVAVNNGDGTFKIKELPLKTQFSCVNTLLNIDINEDGYEDLIMAGNDFEFKPQFSRLDASFGHLLLNDKKNNFVWQDYHKSGFFIKNEVKSLQKITNKNGKIFIIAVINNDKPKLFQLEK